MAPLLAPVWATVSLWWAISVTYLEGWLMTARIPKTTFPGTVGAEVVKSCVKLLSGTVLRGVETVKRGWLL